MIEIQKKISLILLLALLITNLSYNNAKAEKAVQLNQKTPAFMLPKSLFFIEPQVPEKKIQTKTLPEKAKLPDYSKTFNYSYSSLFVSALTAFSGSDMEISSFNSTNGDIRAKFNKRKELIINLTPINLKSTKVTIIPANKVYDLQDSLINQLFGRIESNIK